MRSQEVFGCLGCFLKNNGGKRAAPHRSHTTKRPMEEGLVWTCIWACLGCLGVLKIAIGLLRGKLPTRLCSWDLINPKITKRKYKIILTPTCDKDQNHQEFWASKTDRLECLESTTWFSFFCESLYCGIPNWCRTLPKRVCSFRMSARWSTRTVRALHLLWWANDSTIRFGGTFFHGNLRGHAQEIAGLIFRDYEAHWFPLIRPILRALFLGGGIPLDCHDFGGIHGRKMIVWNLISNMIDFLMKCFHGENGGGPLGWEPLNNQPHIHLI